MNLSAPPYSPHRESGSDNDDEWYLVSIIKSVVLEDIHTPLTEGFFGLNPNPYPSGNSGLASYFPLKILASN